MRAIAIATIVLCLLGVAGALNGAMDALQFHGAAKCFENKRFWDPSVSWENKWANDSGGVKVGEERFWGSSTVFVFATDGWHLLKTLMLLCFFAAIVAAAYLPIGNTMLNGGWFYWSLTFCTCYLAFVAGFHFTYSLIF